MSSRLPEVGDKLLCFGLLQSAQSLLPVGHGLSFHFAHFAHLTIQEFLAALHVATLPNEEKLKVFDARAKSRRFDMVWRFMFGLASKHHGSRSDKVISLDGGLMDKFLLATVPEVPEYLALCHLAFEASDPGFAVRVSNMSDGRTLLDTDYTNRFDYVATFYVLRHAEKYDNMIISFGYFEIISENLLKELTDILSNANGKLQARKLSLMRTNLSDKGVADLFKRASASFTALCDLSLCQNNFTNVMSSFIHTSFTSLTNLNLFNSPLGVSGIQSLETAVRSGAIINLEYLDLNNTLTDDADVNGALLTTLLQSIASHCARLVSLYLADNNLGLPGLFSVVENIPLGLNDIVLENTHVPTSELQYTGTWEMLNLHPNDLYGLKSVYLGCSNLHGTALLIAKILQMFQSLNELFCPDCSLTSADIIMLIHHLKSANVVCKNLKSLDLMCNSIDDEGVIAFTECLPELFPSLWFINSLTFGVDFFDNPVSKEFKRSEV